MITALLLAAVVAGQVKDEPVATKAKAKAQAKALVTSKASAQTQSVVNARRVRRGAMNKRSAVRAVREQAEYEQQLIAQQKAIKEYQAYVVKMGPIWAAENANLIQQQRNALIARQTDIMKQQVDNDAYFRMQLRGR